MYCKKCPCLEKTPDGKDICIIGSYWKMNKKTGEFSCKLNHYMVINKLKPIYDKRAIEEGWADKFK